MIDFKEALEKARQWDPIYDNCTEYENGWVFGWSAAPPSFGGDHQPCVILKESGERTFMPDFICSGTGKEIGEVKF